MLTTPQIRRWYLVHKWTSLVCTVFLLMLCITGLPLIFSDEIEHATGMRVEPPELAAAAGAADLDHIATVGRARYPGEAIRFLIWDDHAPNVFLGLAPAHDAPPDATHYLQFDARTGALLDEPALDEGVMHFLLRLHTDLFTGLPGTLFLGFMGLLFVVSLVSGVVVYAPFMRKLGFGTVRTHRSARLKWLDLHNVVGMATLAWVLVVGLTGAINTLALPILALWKHDQLSAMLAPYAGAQPPVALASVERAVGAAREAAPSMTPSFVAWPGTSFSSAHHYAVFMRGDTPLTARLLKPALIDAGTGTLTAMRDMPWYVSVLLLSQPLHFGDYGGLPLKLLWALLDVFAIVLLGSGVYLWLGRRHSSIEARLAELERGGVDTPSPQPL